MSETKRIALCAGRDYRGVLIYETGLGAVVYGENGARYELESISEAEAFIDATLAMCGSLIGALA
jgi:hypothetical protein